MYLERSQKTPWNNPETVSSTAQELDNSTIISTGKQFISLMVQNLHILTVQKVQKFNSKFNKTIKEASMEDSLMKKEICQVC